MYIKSEAKCKINSFFYSHISSEFPESLRRCLRFFMIRRVKKEDEIKRKELRNYKKRETKPRKSRVLILSIYKLVLVLVLLPFLVAFA